MGKFKVVLFDIKNGNAVNVVDWTKRLLLSSFDFKNIQYLGCETTLVLR